MQCTSHDWHSRPTSATVTYSMLRLRICQTCASRCLASQEFCLPMRRGACRSGGANPLAQGERGRGVDPEVVRIGHDRSAECRPRRSSRRCPCSTRTAALRRAARTPSPPPAVSGAATNSPPHLRLRRESMPLPAPPRGGPCSQAPRLLPACTMQLRRPLALSAHRRSSRAGDSRGRS